ncbi:MAG: FtsX-like permease family protein [Gammaproteobacteria bacterium]|nr:FtsX-like permease family protein [Gammaproteobacteria bacterium]
MDIGPIWRAMLRNKAGFVLIALQMAVTMTVMVNAIAIMQERAGKVARDSGIDEANTFALVSVSFTEHEEELKKSLIDEDLAMIRGLPGVRNAVATNSFPLRQGGWSMSLQLAPGSQSTVSVVSAIYFVDEQGIDTFASKIIDGKNFAADQVTWKIEDDDAWPVYGIITEALGKELFAEEQGSYVGKTFYINDNDPVNVVGVVERLQAPWNGWSGVERSLLVPQRRTSALQRYVIRAEPGYRDSLMSQVEELLSSSNKDRLIRDMTTMDDVRKLSYLGDTAMIKILTFVVGMLTIITGLGIVGLASFNVSRRTRQIGIRRALGATRSAIVRYFLVENFIVSSLGLVIGAILSVALNIAMVQAFSLEPIAWYVIPLAMLALWTVGQVAVAGPARKASKITPAIATRSI